MCVGVCVCVCVLAGFEASARHFSKAVTGLSGFFFCWIKKVLNGPYYNVTNLI